MSTRGSATITKRSETQATELTLILRQAGALLLLYTFSCAFALYVVYYLIGRVCTAFTDTQYIEAWRHLWLSDTSPIYVRAWVVNALLLFSFGMWLYFCLPIVRERILMEIIEPGLSARTFSAEPVPWEYDENTGAWGWKGTGKAPTHEVRSERITNIAPLRTTAKPKPLNVWRRGQVSVPIDAVVWMIENDALSYESARKHSDITRKAWELARDELARLGLACARADGAELLIDRDDAIEYIRENT